jgi:hypothetical protein
VKGYGCMKQELVPLLIRLTLDDTNRDHIYYRDKGWVLSYHYYPTPSGVLKKA